MENHNEISEFIWNIKEHIRDEYAEKDYEEVILPFTLLRRIDCVLEGTHEAVVKANEKYKHSASPEVLDAYVFSIILEKTGIFESRIWNFTN